MNPAFEQYVGIDHSGAKTPKSSLKGLRVYVADGLTAPQLAVVHDFRRLGVAHDNDWGSSRTSS